MSKVHDTQREWLADQLQKAGWGAKSKLAAHLGVRKEAITRILNDGGRQISVAELVQMAEFFGATPPGMEMMERAGQPGRPRARAGPAEAELVDVKTLGADQAAILATAIAGKKAEVWRLTTDGAMSGAGYQVGDFLIVDRSTPARARDVVLADTSKGPVVRLFFPPYLYDISIGDPKPSMVVDNVATIVRGVVISRLSLT